MNRSFVVLLGLAMASLASAQTMVYRSTMPDGRIVYGDHPERGAARVDRRELPPLSVVGPAAPVLSSIGGANVPDSRRAADLDRRLRDRELALDRADAEVKQASIALDRAKERLEQGIEPLPGETTGNAGGGTRLNEIYQTRTLALLNEVAAAQARLDRAYAARNSARD
jgi:hypothetical protein